MIRYARIVSCAAFGLAILFATGASTARADRLHLAGGGTVEVSSWWVENGIVYYRSSAGTVGLPQDSIVRIEPTDAAAIEATDATDATGERVPARPSVNHDKPTSTYRVPVEIARQMEQARTALVARDFDSAASLYASVMQETDEAFQAPRVGYAVARIALGEDDLAHAVVLDALARDPRQPQFLELLGDLLNRQERVEAARDTWREAFEIDPGDRLREKLLKAERELQAASDYDIAATAHYNLRYDDTVDEGLAESVEAYLEQQYWVLADRFDHAPRQPITVVLYPKQDFRDVTQAAEWVGGIYDGKIKVPLGGLRRLTAPAADVLTHELTHAFVHAKSRGQCPRWLHEGLAQQATGQTLSPKDRSHVLTRIRSGDPVAWESKGFSYPIALSLTDHLQRQIGPHGILLLLERMGEGLDVDRALDEVYRGDYAELCRSWAAATVDEATR